MKKSIIIPYLFIASLVNMEAETIIISRDRCREMALANSEDINIAVNAERQAELDRKVADIARLPQLDGSLTGMMMLPDIDMMGSKLQTRGAYMAGLQIVQPIYAGGKITAGRHLAKIGQQVAYEKLRMTRAEVISDADHAYWTYIAVRSKVEMMNRFIAMMDTLYAQTSEAVDVGMAVGNDLLRIESKRSELQYQRQKAANGENLCRMALCNTIGVDLETPVVVADSLPEPVTPRSMVPDITQRPELQMLEMQIKASDEQIKMTRADYLPTVGLSLGYTYYGNIKMKGMADIGGGNFMPFTQEYRDGVLMGILAVDIPIFHWGESNKKIKRARIEAENARMTFEHNRNLMELEARQAAINLSDGKNMIATADIALRQSEENLRVMQNRYDESMASLTDLLDAQTQWYQALSNRIEALTQYQIYLTAWHKANGRL